MLIDETTSRTTPAPDIFQSSPSKTAMDSFYEKLKKAKAKLTEGTEITGNRETVQTSKTVDDSNVIDIKRLAGIK